MIYKYSQLTKRINYNESMKIFNNKEYIYHIGQLKLMMTDMFFISKYYKENLICVVIGAADGGHFIKLAKLFPKVIFHLYDPQDFKVKPSNQIHIFQQFFTDKETEKYSKINNNVIIISDIRNRPSKIKINKKTKIWTNLETNVDIDMQNQKNWVDIIKPIAACLKFRLPYNKDKYKYYDAEVYLQQFGPFSTEGRIIVENTNKLKIYDCKEYDEKLAYFNMTYRDTRKVYLKYKKQLTKYNLKSLYDTIVSCDILRYYYKQIGQEETIDKAIKLFNEIVLFLQTLYSNINYKKLYNK
jgi:cap2 methyltransferase